MIVRALDSDGDWTFGKGKNNYLKDLLAVSQMISTRLNSFLGDCFFDTSAGVDWFNLNGGKSKVAINLAVKTVILNTPFVTGIVELSILLDDERNLSLIYEVSTEFPGNVRGEAQILTTQDGLILTTQDGDLISA